MAQGPGGVTSIDAVTARDPRAIERDIRDHRGELTRLVTELNRRRRELTDVRLQLRRHTVGVATGVLATGLVFAGSLAYARWRAGRRRTLIARSGRLRDAVGRMIERPERVAAEPTSTERLLASVGSAVAAVLIKAILERFTNPPRHA
jgi:hypothetical protein